MKSLNERNQKRICIAAGCFAALLFVLAVFTPQNIDPLNTAWVENGGGDNLQHYIGWRFFREGRWTRYALFMRNLNYPVGTSVIVTDSNPLFSVIFKLMRHFLPESFQFNGIWILCSYLLLGFFAGETAWRVTRNPVLTVCGSIAALLNPVILQRALIHDTLTAHWLILFAILLFLNDGKRWNPAGWFVLTGLTLLIHIYFVPMIAFILCLQVIRMLCKKRPSGMILTPLLTFAAVLVLGYFGLGYNNILPQSGSYGELSMNLNAFFNPDGSSSFLADRPSLPLQYEGFNYLGLGLISLAAAGLVVGGQAFFRKILPYLLPAAVLIVLAASNNGYFDHMLLWSIHLPENIYETMSVFRSSGRLVWPIYYLILFGALWALVHSRLSGKVILTLAVCCTILQGADLASYCAAAAQRFRNPERVLPDIPAELDAVVPESAAHLFVSDGDGKLSDALALFAADRHLTYNRIANARPIKKVFGGDELDMTSLTCAQIVQDSVYIYLSGEIPEGLVSCGRIDVSYPAGWAVVTASE